MQMSTFSLVCFIIKALKETLRHWPIFWSLLRMLGVLTQACPARYPDESVPLPTLTPNSASCRQSGSFA